MCAGMAVNKLVGAEIGGDGCKVCGMGEDGIKIPSSACLYSLFS